MKAYLLICLTAIVLFWGCGGAGVGGGTIRVTGRILSVSTGGPPSPPATVQIGSASVLTEPGSGIFIINVQPGADSMTVLSNFPSFTFDFPPILQDTDIGDFWIGPETVIIRGSVVNSQTNNPEADAFVTFAGMSATTDGSGTFALVGVAYDSQNEFVFQGIFGRVSKVGFLTAEFSVIQNPIGGVIDIPSILIAPISDPDPPGPPFNIWGFVTVEGEVPTGTIVTLLQGGNTVRVFNVGSTGRYLFWTPPADYTLRFEKVGFQTQEIQITGFTDPDQIIRNDVHLIP